MYRNSVINRLLLLLLLLLLVSDDNDEDDGNDDNASRTSSFLSIVCHLFAFYERVATNHQQNLIIYAIKLMRACSIFIHSVDFALRRR